MKVFFDSQENFMKDLEAILIPLDKFDNPLVVLPTERDTRICTREFGKDDKYKHITFISYEYWLSKKWVADGEYDNIDFFKIDKFLRMRSYGTRVGCATVDRTMSKKPKEEEENDPS